MSLQGLISGSECAIPNNPLSQVLKHAESDRSMQQDRIAGPSSSQLQHLPSTVAGQANASSISMARQFFDQNVPGAPSQILIAQAQRSFANTLLENTTSLSRTSLGDVWGRTDSQRHVQSPMPQIHGKELSWSAEFDATSAMHSPPRSSNAPQISAPQVTGSLYMPSQTFYQPSPNIGMYGAGISQSYTFRQDQRNGKGKGKSRADAFEEAFAQYEASAKIEEVHDDNVAEAESALRNMSMGHENDVQRETSEGPASTSEFKRMWDELQKSELPPPEEDMARLEAEFRQLMEAQGESLENDYGASMKEAWENGLGAYDGTNMPDRLEFDDEGIPKLEPYSFDPTNKYLAMPFAKSALAEAKWLIENNGPLTEAALLLEAAIQKGELGEDGYEAWILLGETRSMDEREELAMRALTEGVRRAEESAAKGAGMLSLAISYTNEGYERGSHTMLMRWLQARFPEYTPSPEATASLKQSHWASRDSVTDAFLTIARQQHAKGIVDPDVQTGLGVLFYTNGDFDRAKDCFESALAARPNDYLLWNRLGSSLSNGNKPEEALGAYRQALQMRPAYTRAIYNVGVACLNIGAYKEAAEHILSALALQENTSGVKSEQLWFTLRRTFISMGREDLASTAKEGGNIDSFRAEGFSF